jgi:hypothetical protein
MIVDRWLQSKKERKKERKHDFESSSPLGTAEKNKNDGQGEVMCTCYGMYMSKDSMYISTGA